MIHRRGFLGGWLLGLFALGLSALPTWARNAPAQRLHGTVQTLSGDMLTLQPENGKPVTIKLAADWKVSTMAPMKLTDIKPNDFVGVAASGPDSHLVAIQVVLFPEALRGAGEGHYPWSVQPKDSMTNATVTRGSAVQADGRTLTLTFKGKSLSVLVPPTAKLLRLEIGKHSRVAPGAKVEVTAMASAGGLTANRVTVAIDGAAPPT